MKAEDVTVAIVGFGRFGKVLYELLKDDFKVLLYTRSVSTFDEVELSSNSTVVDSPDKIYQAQVIFYAVPIESFEGVIAEHMHFITDQLLIDVLSVKVHAQNVFSKELEKSDARYLLTHPMFGPDSAKEGFAGLPMIMDQGTSTDHEYDFWRGFFAGKELKVVEMSAEEHDKAAAYSQGLTHFIGRLLDGVEFEPTAIDSKGSELLHTVVDQTCNDTWQLFENLQNYNPYTRKMRVELGEAYDDIYNKLLPERVDPKQFVFGIQGGRGSFNEEALQEYLKRERIENVRTEYLYTTENVLRELHEGTIDFGVFAVSNVTGGAVRESLEAMSNHKFVITSEVRIVISHNIMKLPEVPFESITKLMAHPQVFRQCRNTLAKRHPDLPTISGEGELIDHARAAQALQEGEIEKDIAIVGPKILAEIYDLEIVDHDLQDFKDNRTWFLIVQRS